MCFTLNNDRRGYFWHPISDQLKALTKGTAALLITLYKHSRSKFFHTILTGKNDTRTSQEMWFLCRFSNHALTICDQNSIANSARTSQEKWFLCHFSNHALTICDQNSMANSAKK